MSLWPILKYWLWLKTQKSWWNPLKHNAPHFIFNMTNIIQFIKYAYLPLWLSVSRSQSSEEIVHQESNQSASYLLRVPRDLLFFVVVVIQLFIFIRISINYTIQHCLFYLYGRLPVISFCLHMSGHGEATGCFRKIAWIGI